MYIYIYINKYIYINIYIYIYKVIQVRKQCLSLSKKYFNMMIYIWLLTLVHHFFVKQKSKGSWTLTTDGDKTLKHFWLFLEKRSCKVKCIQCLVKISVRTLSSKICINDIFSWLFFTNSQQNLEAQTKIPTQKITKLVINFCW